MYGSLFRSIDSSTLVEHVRAASKGDGEIAVIDVREQKAYAEGLILLSTNLPLQRLELSVATALPRLHTPIVIVDRHGELAAQAVERLHALGYQDLAVLDGGIERWQADGLPLYSGFNVRSKAFAEHVEHAFATPGITATELFARQAGGDDILVLDSRPFAEYHYSTVPGALSVPGAELVRSVRDITPAPSTTLVVSCGGRTRSIIGAQSLISAGVPNPVLTLRNGTGGLRLDGIELEYGANRAHSPASEAALDWAQSATEHLVNSPPLTTSAFSALLGDGQRSLYVFDLREADAYAAGHHPLARHVSGGQLLQAIDVHAPVWNARIVLIDDGALVRARQTAYWLEQLGSFEVALMAQPEVPDATAQGPQQVPVRPIKRATVEHVSAAELAEALQHNAPSTPVQVVDLALSPAYRQGHIADSRWALRSELQQLLAQGPGRIVLTCESGQFADVAGQYLVAEQPALASRVQVLTGGNQAWRAAGFPLVASVAQAPADVAHFIDVWTPPQQTVGDLLGAVKAYLTWEVGLLEQLARDPLQAILIRGVRPPSPPAQT
ncbi:rhodanese-like domain-containing protein [Pseudomonas typographi]|uniref:rhodanese-like domain-containing protein n=1 Tax=Pseudomonas typographi TaxID=2715964 RepID=UPI001682C4AF|nr:rhodanese-like domain-containing protein [Pseudomonas typographi]MBD1587522.1 rhodanese-related sulfurtransferase [Pseudomonas typographi]